MVSQEKQALGLFEQSLNVELRIYDFESSLPQVHSQRMLLRMRLVTFRVQPEQDLKSRVDLLMQVFDRAVVEYICAEYCGELAFHRLRYADTGFS